MSFAIVVSRFNQEVTDGLLYGAIKYLQEKGTPIQTSDIFRVPGAFEIPLVAQQLAKTKKYRGIICLGCLIKGDTAHFEYISQSATLGLMQGSLSTETPLSFGILTTYDEEQAKARSQKDSQNKGREAASACFETAELLAKIAK
jgi:6,7-dimethyl-8-ribityllumazine synthase